jgi:uncharacterized protein YbjT (DUF2867 family)
MNLITGAGGKTGRAIVQALAGKGQPVRAFVFRSEQIETVERLGAKSVLVGDIRDPEVRKEAMQGVESVYHICPNVHPDEVTIGKGVIDAAAAAGVSHFVYHSVLHPQIEAMPHHWKKMRVEEYLFESRLSYAILQPAVYMQNMLANWDSITQAGKYSVPYAVESRLSMVDLEDVAISAVIVLTEKHPGNEQPLHHGAIYELAGTQAMTQSEVADILSQELGLPVVAERLPVETWEARARAAGMSEYEVTTLIKMFVYYDQFGLSGNPNVLSWLLNRPATSFEDFVKRAVETRRRYGQ